MTDKLVIALSTNACLSTIVLLSPPIARCPKFPASSLGRSVGKIVAPSAKHENDARGIDCPSSVPVCANIVYYGMSKPARPTDEAHRLETLPRDRPKNGPVTGPVCPSVPSDVSLAVSSTSCWSLSCILLRDLGPPALPGPGPRGLRSYLPRTRFAPLLGLLH